MADSFLSMLDLHSLRDEGLQPPIWKQGAPFESARWTRPGYFASE